MDFFEGDDFSVVLLKRKAQSNALQKYILVVVSALEDQNFLLKIMMLIVKAMMSMMIRSLMLMKTSC